MSKVKLRDIMSLSMSAYTADGHEFIEHSLKLKCTPEIAVQLLAFGGMAHNDKGEVVHVADWDSISPHVLQQVRRTFSIGYKRVALKQIKPESDGAYIFASGQVMATVENGGVAMPDPKEARKRATNFGSTVLL